MEDSKKYELAYLLSTKISEGEVLARSGELAKLIEGAGGKVVHQEVPQRRNLAYTVKNEKSAYFGWTVFTAAPELLMGLEKKIKTMEVILRHSVFIRGDEAPYQPTRAYSYRPRQVETKVYSRSEAAKPEEKFDLEELDKKLEEILGK